MSEYEELKQRLITIADLFDESPLSELLDDARQAIERLENRLYENMGDL